MFHDPNMPDFDSMSQEELIAWLETLAQRQKDDAAEYSAEYERELDGLDADLVEELVEEAGEWGPWLEEDEDLQQDTPPIVVEVKLEAEQILEAGDDDDETPTAFTIIDEGDSDDTTDPLTWLEDLTVEAPENELSEVSDDRELEQEYEGLDIIIDEDELEDPLDWLDSLANEVSNAAAAIDSGAEMDAEVDVIDDEYEDDETLEDVEDKSLYSQRVEDSVAFLESLVDLPAQPADEFSTQSMAPVPDFLMPPVDEAPPEPVLVEDRQDNSASPPPAQDKSDNLTQAFLLQGRQDDLEAWYATRLQAVAGSTDTATQQVLATSPQTPPAGLSPLQAPPPGLAAGFNSARGKTADGRLHEALSDYETLLRANIGLDLVVSDMNWLIAQEQYRDNPAVHRVLGDALMRQGELQAALDVYRHALTLL